MPRIVATFGFDVTMRRAVDLAEGDVIMVAPPGGPAELVRLARRELRYDPAGEVDWVQFRDKRGLPIGLGPDEWCEVVEI